MTNYSYKPNILFVIVQCLIYISGIIIAAVMANKETCPASAFDLPYDTWLLTYSIVQLIYALFPFLLLILIFCICCLPCFILFLVLKSRTL